MGDTFRTVVMYLRVTACTCPSRSLCIVFSRLADAADECIRCRRVAMWPITHLLETLVPIITAAFLFRVVARLVSDVTDDVSD